MYIIHSTSPPSWTFFGEPTRWPKRIIYLSLSLSVYIHILGAPEITANIYFNCLYLYWEGCVICSIYLQ